MKGEEVNKEMFHYFKKPAKPEDIDYDLIADTFYRIRPFWLPSLLIGAILGFPVLSIFMACMFAPFLAEGESVVEIIKGIAPFFVAGVVLVCLGIFLLWAVTLSWRKEDYVSELIRNAEAYGLYDSDYIRSLGNSIRRGIAYRCTYLCLADNFIIGSIYRPGGSASPFCPIAIPKGCIKDIYFNFSTYTAPVPGAAGRTYYYDSGIEITVNSGKVIVIPYGTKQSVGRSVKAFKKSGYSIH